MTNTTSNWVGTSSDFTPSFGDYTDNYIQATASSPYADCLLFIAWSDGRLGFPNPFEARSGSCAPAEWRLPGGADQCRPHPIPHTPCVTPDDLIRLYVVDDDLPCKELVELVTDYLEDRLAPLDRQRFEAHLAQCSGCRTYLEQMRQTVRALGRLTEESIDPEARERLLSVFRDWKRGAT